jgi:hypothetical protein
MRSPCVLVCLLLTIGCAPPESGVGVPGGGLLDTGAGADLWDGCDAEDGLFDRVEITATETPTVMRATWITTRPVAGSVAFTGDDGRLRLSAPGPVGTHHNVLLLGLRSDTDLTAVARAEEPGGVTCAASVEARTGSLPSSMVPIRVEADEPALLDGGHVLVSVIQAEQSWVTVLDDRGAVVFVWQVDVGDGKPGQPVFRVMPSPDGAGLLFNQQANGIDEPGHLGFVSWDGASRWVSGVPGGHTDVALLPDGGYAMLGWTIRDMPDGQRILGDTVVVVGADGNQRVVWDVFEHFSPIPGVEYPRGFVPGDPDAEDWSHANGISYDPVRDEILVSLPFAAGVVGIDPWTEEQRWALTPFEGDFELPDGPGLMEQPHSVEASDAGLLVFNRNDWYRQGSCSEAVEIAVDRPQAVAREVWSYEGPDCQRVGFLGSATRLPSDGVLVSFSSAGVLDVATPEAELAWRVRVDLGAAFGFATYAEDLFRLGE